jgi:hypothetical protein
MKHLTFADKTLLVGDSTANLIMEYASQLAQHQTADTVTISAIDGDGNDVNATLLLDAGAPLMVETATTTATEPENAGVDDYMAERISQYVRPSSAMSIDRQDVDDQEVDMPREW